MMGSGGEGRVVAAAVELNDLAASKENTETAVERKEVDFVLGAIESFFLSFVSESASNLFNDSVTRLYKLIRRTLFFNSQFFSL